MELDNAKLKCIKSWTGAHQEGCAKHHTRESSMEVHGFLWTTIQIHTSANFSLLECSNFQLA
jgi:hypothetical protein